MSTTVVTADAAESFALLNRVSGLLRESGIEIADEIRDRLIKSVHDGLHIRAVELATTSERAGELRFRLDLPESFREVAAALLTPQR